MQFLRSSFVVLHLLLCGVIVAESSDRPHGHATRLPEAPTLDGKVADDPAWDGIAPFTGFIQLQPDNGAPASQRTEVYFGFDVKYSVTPSLTLDLTYNTDFAQVESDRQQVNLGRFSLFFPETRPFFLENAGAFNVGFQGTQLFHSRRIGIAPDSHIFDVL